MLLKLKQQYFIPSGQTEGIISSTSWDTLLHISAGDTAIMYFNWTCLRIYISKPTTCGLMPKDDHFSRVSICTLTKKSKCTWSFLMFLVTMCFDSSSVLHANQFHQWWGTKFDILLLPSLTGVGNSIQMLLCIIHNYYCTVHIWQQGWPWYRITMPLYGTLIRDLCHCHSSTDIAREERPWEKFDTILPVKAFLSFNQWSCHVQHKVA